MIYVALVDEIVSNVVYGAPIGYHFLWQKITYTAHILKYPLYNGTFWFLADLDTFSKELSPIGSAYIFGNIRYFDDVCRIFKRICFEFDKLLFDTISCDIKFLLDTISCDIKLPTSYIISSDIRFCFYFLATFVLAFGVHYRLRLVWLYRSSFLYRSRKTVSPDIQYFHIFSGGY